MSTHARRLARVALASGLTVVAAECVTDRGPREADAVTSAAVQRLALDSLFDGREHALRLVVWATNAADGPVLESLGSMITRPAVARPIDVARLALSVPAHVMTEASVAALFRENPDGWAAFFRDNPGAAGLIELSPVWLSPDARTATTYIGRSCGEHCRNAWRLLAYHDRTRWRIAELQWLRVPGV